MNVFVLSLHHGSASEEQLETLLAPERRAELSAWIAQRPDLVESALLTTCLRFELYGVSEDPGAIEVAFRAEAARLLGVEPARVPILRADGEEAVLHLTRVTSGLESILWGEASVTTQVRNAYRAAVDGDTCGPWLHRAFHLALQTTRRLRAEAQVRSPFGSFSGLAVRALEARVSADTTWLIVGSGAAGHAAVREARGVGVQRLRVMSADRETGLALAEVAHGTYHEADDWANALEGVGAIVTASSRGALVSAELLSAHLQAGQTIAIADLGVPRNVSLSAGRHSLPILHSGRGTAQIDLLRLQDLAGFARARGEERAMGPLSESTSDALLLLVDGFNHQMGRGTAAAPPWEPILEELRTKFRVWSARKLAPAEEGAAQECGLVSLVGAGPGDPELLTLRAVDRLARAEVVLHDALVSAEVLALASRRARLVDVGRRAGKPGLPAAEVHELMIRSARLGRRVVRLKGGDPAVFGRLREETDALTAAQVPFEVVPGITAALAAASSLAMPLTDRETATSCAIVTLQFGVEGEARLARLQRLVEIVRHVDSLAIYMGAGELEELTRVLLAAGRPLTERLAVVERASLPDETRRVATLGEIAFGILGDIATPALILVGPTVAAGAPHSAPPSAEQGRGRRSRRARRLRQGGPAREARGSRDWSTPAPPAAAPVEPTLITQSTQSMVLEEALRPFFGEGAQRDRKEPLGPSHR